MLHNFNSFSFFYKKKTTFCLLFCLFIYCESINKLNIFIMKKLLCIALFSMAIMANANNKKEIATSSFKEVKSDMTFQLEGVNQMTYDYETSSEALTFEGCGERGNNLYDQARKDGNSHREARQLRRADVRKCRGLPENGWLGATLDAVRELKDFISPF